MAAIVEELRELSDQNGSEDQHQYLTFRLASESFAIGILAVKEILEYGLVTAVPMMPDYVRGVINLRGRVVPVVDLARRFGGGATMPSRRTCIIIVEIGTESARQDIGVIVDGVSQVVEIPPGSIEPPPSFGAKMRTDFIAGMGKLDGGFVILLDIERILSAQEISAMKQSGDT